MTNQKRLTLCVITKNEEELLPGCLSRMKGIADEIIVADLGSGDRTRELAKEAGAAVYPVVWEDDFSKIKNFCMERATGQWVLFLQADEEISADQQKELCFLLKNPNAEGYLLYVDYHPEERGVSSPDQFLRLIRNRQEYRFCGRSFEYVPDEVLGAIQDAHLTITHRGHSTVTWQLTERQRLLESDKKENPGDSYVWYMEGIELLNRGEYARSAVSLEQARQLVNWGYLYAPHLYKCLCFDLLYLERYEEAEKILTEGVKAFPLYSDLLVLRAQVYRELGLSRNAQEDLINCTILRKRPSSFVPGAEIDDSVIEEMLEEILTGAKEE